MGKLYDREGKFIGYYCDIIRPVARLLASASKTSIITDLFLYLWISRDGRCVALDEEQLEHALTKREVSRSLAMRARRELETLIGFPPSLAG